ncbi:MAG: glutaredoxin family protein, partial [Thiogranum sp.]
IYKWKDANGRVHIGDQPPDPSSAQQISVRVNTYKSSAVEGRENAHKSAREKVVIYTTSRCGYCKKAKAWFRSRGVAFTEYDVENSNKGQRDYKKLGGSGVPIILVGEQRLNGFSEGRLGAALRKAGYTL